MQIAWRYNTIFLSKIKNLFLQPYERVYLLAVLEDFKVQVSDLAGFVNSRVADCADNAAARHALALCTRLEFDRLAYMVLYRFDGQSRL